jgi:hypothetical protein
MYNNICHGHDDVDVPYYSLLLPHPLFLSLSLFHLLRIRIIGNDVDGGME